MPYAEFPGDEIVEFHVKREPPDGGGGGGGGPCVPLYVANVLPTVIFYTGGVTTINPWFCCPPHYFVGEEVYGQKTVYASGSPKLTIHWTLNDIPDTPSHNAGMGVWLFPDVAPSNIEKLYNYVKTGENTYTIFGPAGDPYLLVPAPGTTGVLEIDIPPGLHPSNIPGAPPADDGVFGTTIILSGLFHEAATGNWVPLTRAWIDFQSVVEFRHQCPPGSSPTAEARDIHAVGFPPFSRPQRDRR